MPTAAISFNGYEFETNGRPHFNRTSRYESDGTSGPVRRAITTFAIVHQFNGETFGENQLSYQKLLTAMRVPEGRLLIVDEFENDLVDLLVRPQDSNLPDQWGQHLLEVTLNFQVTEIVSAGVDAKCAGVVLTNVGQWRESVRTERPTFAVNNRRETTVVLSASGRYVANPQASEAERRAALQAKRDEIRTLADHKQAELTFGTFDKTVRVDSIEADLAEGSYELLWSLSASYRRFPDGTFVEAEYTVTSREDTEKAERLTTVRGKIRSDAIDTARERLTELTALYKTGSRTVRNPESSEELIEGADGAANYAEVTFSVEYREVLGYTNFTLSTSTRQESRSGQTITTYSGRVNGGSAGTAVNMARALGLGNYGLILSSTETVGTSKINQDPTQFIEVTFSYEYATKGDWAWAEITGETDTQRFGRGSASVSGSCTAKTSVAAYAMARGFKRTGLLVVSERETEENEQRVSGLAGATASLFIKVNFSYSYALQNAAGTLEYSRRISKDYEAREMTITYSGNAYGPSEGSANALVDTLVSIGSGQKYLRDDRDAHYRKDDAASVFDSLSFSVSVVSPFSPGNPDDIISADFNLAITYSVNHAVITPIPFGTPFVQQNCGWTPGLKVASGSATAGHEAAARAWARGQRALAIGGGYEDPPEERMDHQFQRFSGSQIKAYRCQFTYSARFPYLPLG